MVASRSSEDGRKPVEVAGEDKHPDVDAAQTLARTGGAESADHVDAIRPEPAPDDKSQGGTGRGR